MIQVTSEQWLYWLHLYFWPLLRVLALISTAPILSERAIPKRVKLGLGIMITLVIAPSLPANDTPLFSIAALWLAMQQILIGIALGFTMQFAFAAVRTAGEFIGLQMGLSFATFVDPGSHLNMPVLARIMDMLAMLLFLTFNGHLWLISLLVDTFHTLPIGSNPVNSNAFMALARAGGLIFLNGLMLALPVITLLLTLNLALGLLNRMAPQLSIFVIGFPLTLTVGIMLMAALMPLIAPFCEHLFSEIFNLLADIVSEMPINNCNDPLKSCSGHNEWRSQT
ncbi:flagellar biosynthetic protein FliR [Salmonella enterica]|nr:flagellar biosynthetic protein FliR [Salmonella enterica]